MLHLLPIRLLLTVFALVVMAAYALALRAGFVTAGTMAEIAVGIFKVATPLVLGIMVSSLALWRWSPPVLQNLVFPYLGGAWEGAIEFLQSGAPVTRPATLEAVHTLASLKFALRTAESTSETTLVHARKVPVEKDLVKLVYIYQVERLEGVPGAGERYRGCAFLDVDLKTRTMTGSYMAGAGRAGTIRMRLVRRTPWWKIWR